MKMLWCRERLLYGNGLTQNRPDNRLNNEIMILKKRKFMARDSCRDFHTSVFFANQTTNQLNYEINKHVRKWLQVTKLVWNYRHGCKNLFLYNEVSMSSNRDIIDRKCLNTCPTIWLLISFPIVTNRYCNCQQWAKGATHARFTSTPQNKGLFTWVTDDI